MTKTKIMTNSKDYSAIGKSRHYKILAIKSIAIAVATYSGLGLVFDAVPFPGVGFFHSSEVQNSHINTYSPSGNFSFKSLDLHRDVNSVSDEEARTARELAGSDAILDKDEIKAACNQVAGDASKVDSINLVISDLKNHKIQGVRVSAWNVNGCSQKVSN